MQLINNHNITIKTESFKLVNENADKYFFYKASFIKKLPIV